MLNLDKAGSLKRCLVYQMGIRKGPLVQERGNDLDIYLGSMRKSIEESPDGNQNTITKRGVWKFPVHMA